MLTTAIKTFHGEVGATRGVTIAQSLMSSRQAPAFAERSDMPGHRGQSSGRGVQEVRRPYSEEAIHVALAAIVDRYPDDFGTADSVAGPPAQPADGEGAGPALAEMSSGD